MGFKRKQSSDTEQNNKQNDSERKNVQMSNTLSPVQCLLFSISVDKYLNIPMLGNRENKVLKFRRAINGLK